MKSKLVKLLIGTMSIFLGGMIYVLFRKDSLLMFHWFDFIGCLQIIEHLRAHSVYLIKLLPSWVIYSLPTGLWLFGGILLFSSIWGKIVYVKIIWITLFALVAIGSELGQYFGLVRGTYDLMDLIVMVISIATAVFIDYIFFNREHYEK
jgi:hypothetical protein